MASDSEDFTLSKPKPEFLNFTKTLMDEMMKGMRLPDSCFTLPYNNAKEEEERQALWARQIDVLTGLPLLDGEIELLWRAGLPHYPGDSWSQASKEYAIKSALYDRWRVACVFLDIPEPDVNDREAKRMGRPVDNRLRNWADSIMRCKIKSCLYGQEQAERMLKAIAPLPLFRSKTSEPFP